MPLLVMSPILSVISIVIISKVIVILSIVVVSFAPKYPQKYRQHWQPIHLTREIGTIFC